MKHSNINFDYFYTDIEELHKEFHNPKSILFHVLNEAFLRDQSLDIKPSITVEQLQEGKCSSYDNSNLLKTNEYYVLIIFFSCC